MPGFTRRFIDGVVCLAVVCSLTQLFKGIHRHLTLGLTVVGLKRAEGTAVPITRFNLVPKPRTHGNFVGSGIEDCQQGSCGAHRLESHVNPKDVIDRSAQDFCSPGRFKPLKWKDRRYQGLIRGCAVYVSDTIERVIAICSFIHAPSNFVTLGRQALVQFA